jgi:hypothetical protein
MFKNVLVKNKAKLLQLLIVYGYIVLFFILKWRLEGETNEYMSIILLTLDLL